MIQPYSKKNKSSSPGAGETDLYQLEFVQNLVAHWDELIDWEARSISEGRFFIDVLQEKGAKNVLDVATGTGFHSVLLLQEGFQVASVDGSQEMLAKAFENALQKNFILRAIHTDWRWLGRDVHEKFDAVICLGNAFTYLFSERDRRKALIEFYAVLEHDGILILDQRNYDAILEGHFSSRKAYYYCGESVKVEPEHVDEKLVRFRYEFTDNSVFYLDNYPLRKTYMQQLMKEVGFQRIKTYGDFKETYHHDEPDFFIHVAEKKYEPAKSK